MYIPCSKRSCRHGGSFFQLSARLNPFFIFSLAVSSTLFSTAVVSFLAMLQSFSLASSAREKSPFSAIFRSYSRISCRPLTATVSSYRSMFWTVSAYQGSASAPISRLLQYRFSVDVFRVTLLTYSGMLRTFV